jgi:hypothetical protein
MVRNPGLLIPSTELEVPVGDGHTLALGKTAAVISWKRH